MRLYGLKNCDTCKKAMKALESKGVDFTFVDIRGGSVDKAQIERWLQKAGAEALVNKRSTSWRNLSDAQKLLAEKNPTKLLADNLTLIKRPVIETGGDILVGWSKEVQSRLV
jgi:Spx/MgsR family transcriptional regulator